MSIAKQITNYVDINPNEVLSIFLMAYTQRKWYTLTYWSHLTNILRDTEIKYLKNRNVNRLS